MPEVSFTRALFRCRKERGVKWRASERARERERVGQEKFARKVTGADIDVKMFVFDYQKEEGCQKLLVPPGLCRKHR